MSSAFFSVDSAPACTWIPNLISSHSHNEATQSQEDSAYGSLLELSCPSSLSP